jgi:hypothetical protein
VIYRNRLIFKVRYFWPHVQPRSWRYSHCLLSACAFSLYLQLPSTSGDLLLHMHPEKAPSRGDKGPAEYGLVNTRISLYRVIFNKSDAFTARRFTVTGALQAAKSTRISQITQHTDNLWNEGKFLPLVPNHRGS